MTDLPSQCAMPLVRMNSAKPTSLWLTGRVAALLSHFYQPSVSDEEYRMIMADWRDVLGDIPAQAIEDAIRIRLRSADRTRPTPGEIRQLAMGRIDPQDEAERRARELLDSARQWLSPERDGSSLPSYLDKPAIVDRLIAEGNDVERLRYIGFTVPVDRQNGDQKRLVGEVIKNIGRNLKA